ncbi:minor tail protein [Mycobacterium phage Ageofdapage]|nr:minor tail protein [Mycobacterium phage Ageofdapage]
MPSVYDRHALVVDRDPLRQLTTEYGKLPKLDPAMLWKQWIDGFKTLTGIDLSSPQALVASLGDLIGGALDPEKLIEVLTQVFGYIGPPLASLEALAAWVNSQIFGLIDPRRLAQIPLGSIVQESPNLMSNGSFTDAIAIDDETGRWVRDTTTYKSAPASARTTADGTIAELLSIDLIPVKPKQKLDIAGFVRWADLAASDGSIVIGLMEYGDAGEHRVGIEAVEGASGTQTTWQKIGGQYVVPDTGVDSVRVLLGVYDGATAGRVWFDELSASLGANLLPKSAVDGLVAELKAAFDSAEAAAKQFLDFLQNQWQAMLNGIKGGVGGAIEDLWNRLLHLTPDGLFDASQLVNVGNMPQLPPSVVAGIEGIENIGDTIQQAIDYLWSGFRRQTGQGKSFSSLAQAAQETSNDIQTAVHLATMHAGILSERRNKPAHWGLADTVEVSFALSDIAYGTTAPTIPITSQTPRMAFIRCGETATKGFVQWLGHGNPDAFYVNVYKMDADGNLAHLHTSPNLSNQLQASIGWEMYVFAGTDQTEVDPGDVLAVEFVVEGAGTYNIAGCVTSWVPVHPSANTKHLGALRGSASGGRAPATIPAEAISWSGTVPWVSIGISNVPPSYQPPTATEFNQVGQHTYEIPLWANYVDVIACGAGGGGGSSANFLTGQGGECGHWIAATLVRGRDFAEDATTITVIVGTGGAGGPLNANAGSDGEPTGIVYVKPDGSVGTITAPGGQHGGPGPVHNGDNPNSASAGMGAPNYQYRGATYFGGPDASYAPGSTPGGGGAGGFSYSAGSAGGRGAAWLVARQSEDD